MLQYVVGKFGSDRVILGSDYPFPLGEMDYPGRLIEETYADGVETEGGVARVHRENMLWRNAASFLKLQLKEVGNECV